MQEILKREDNPYTTLTASVESDGRTVYLYLNPIEGIEAASKAVWVMNLIPAPEDDSESMSRGQAPMQRKAACRHPAGLILPSADEMDLVWFSEGTAVSLFIDGEIAAVIPPFAGQDGFYGFSREAIAPDNGTFPMPSGMQERGEENLEYWNRRTQKTFWKDFRDQLLAEYETAFGTHTGYYILDGGKFPAMAMAEFTIPESYLENEADAKKPGKLFATVGMSAQNMPAVELHVKNPEPLFRIELVTIRDEPHPWFIDIMARTALFPWRSTTWIGPGHSIQFQRKEPFSDFLIAEPHLISDKPLISAFDKIPRTILEGRYARTLLFAVPVDSDDIRVANVRGRQRLLQKIKLLDRF
ncbi:MAG: suppressor of fused domain protein [Spirochaetia bacterium]|nr:suppressor of fused domain protein [Spirochaetia bacterium]